MTTLPSPKAKKPFWRRFLKWTLRTAIVVVVLGIAAYAITYYWTAKTINAEIARIRAAGEPLTFADLDTLSPKVDRAQDAGPLYAAASALVSIDYENAMDTNYEAFFGYDAPTKPVSVEALAWAAKNVASNHDALDLLDRAAELPGCNADIQLQYGISVALDHLGPKRALLNAASLRTRALALEGKGDAAVDSVVSCVGLLRTLDRQPVLIASLVQVAILSRICSDAAVVISYGNSSPTALQKLDDALQHAHLVPLRQMFIAERVYSLEIMRNLITSGAESSPPTFDAPLLPERQNFTSLGLTGRYMMAEVLPIFREDIDATSGDFTSILKEAEKQGRKPASTLHQLLGPNFEKPMVLYGRALASNRAVQVAIKIHYYQAAHNQNLPESLDQLPNPGDLPKDPFTNAGLLYVKTESGYCVMSAGRGHPEDDGNIHRESDPIGWSARYGVHITTH